MRYIVVIEKEDDSCGAYVPDLPGVISVSDSEEDSRTGPTASEILKRGDV